MQVNGPKRTSRSNRFLKPWTLRRVSIGSSVPAGRCPPSAQQALQLRDVRAELADDLFELLDARGERGTVGHRRSCEGGRLGQLDRRGLGDVAHQMNPA